MVYDLYYFYWFGFFNPTQKAKTFLTQEKNTGKKTQKKTQKQKHKLQKRRNIKQQKRSPADRLG